MTQQECGSHYYAYTQWENLLHQPYDYKHKGLMQHIMPRKIVNTTNPLLQDVLLFIDRMYLYCLQYIGVLENFHNYNKFNR